VSARADIWGIARFFCGFFGFARIFSKALIGVDLALAVYGGLERDQDHEQEQG
jgi:hypothetical protein